MALHAARPTLRSSLTANASFRLGPGPAHRRSRLSCPGHSGPESKHNAGRTRPNKQFYTPPDQRPRPCPRRRRTNLLLFSASSIYLGHGQPGVCGCADRTPHFPDFLPISESDPKAERESVDNCANSSRAHCFWQILWPTPESYTACSYCQLFPQIPTTQAPKMPTMGQLSVGLDSWAAWKRKSPP